MSVENVINKDNKKSSFIPTVIVLCLLTYLRDNMGFTVPIDLLTVVFGLGFLFFERRDFIALCVVEPLFYASIRTTWVFLIALIVYYFKFGNIRKITKYQAIVAVLMIIEFFHIMIEPFSMIGYVGYLITYWYMATMLGEMFYLDNEDKKYVMIAYVALFLFVMFDILLIFLGYYGSFASMLTGSIRFGNIDRLHWFLDLDYYINLNENTVAMYAIVAVGVCLSGYYQKSKRNYWWLIAMFLSMLFGLATMSRSFLLCLAIILIFWIFIVLKKHSISRTNIFSLIIIGAGIAAGGGILATQISNILARFLEANITGSRNLIFALYNDFFFAHPQYWLTGIGLQSIDLKIGVNRVTHNGIQETYICFGILGLLLVFLLFIYAFMDAKSRLRDKHIQLESLIPFIGYFAFTQTIQFVRLSSVYLFLPLVFMVLVYDYRLDTDIQER